MSEPQKPQRRNLSLPLASVRSVEPDASTGHDSAKETAQRHGFDNVPIPASEVDRLRANQASEPPRRKRGAGR
ncbi:hypothetical protein, partial [Rhizorhapis suberifaciens]